MTPIGWDWALLVWGYCFIWFLLNDRLKLGAYRLFDPQESPQESIIKPRRSSQRWSQVIKQLSAVGAGLYGLGMDNIVRYKTAIKNNKFILIAHGSTNDATQAKEILDRTQPETLERLPIAPSAKR